MLNIDVKNPKTAQLLTILAGIATILVAQYAPHWSVTLSQVLNVLGISAIGAGGLTYTQKPPSSGNQQETGTTEEAAPRPSQRPPGGVDAPMRGFRAAVDEIVWRLRLRLVLIGVGLALALVACAAACDPRTPPCDESKLRAIDERYATAVLEKCLAKYDAKEQCPEFEGLQAEHRRQLREACPQ